MKIKIGLYGTGNKNNCAYLILEKNKNFFKWLEHLLKKVFDYIDPIESKIVHLENSSKLVKKNPKDYIDVHEAYGLKEGDIDIFYGKEKAFLIINIGNKNREKFMKLVLETTEWKKTTGYILGKNRGMVP